MALEEKEGDKKVSIGDYDTIMSDRNIFNQIVYTPLSEALRLLEERQKDPELIAKIEKLLKGDIPEVLKNKKCCVLSRHIATPNYESRKFMSIAKDCNLTPVFFEYHDDKFTPNVNIFKRSLAQIFIQKKFDRNGNDFSEKITIVDFNKNGGKKLRELTTLWGEPLINFHRKLFKLYGENEKDFYFYNGSDWYKRNGVKAMDYYTNFLLLFTCYGILFENFLFSDENEKDFTKNVMLSALEKVVNLTGVKPLIVPIETFDLETDGFWFHHLLNVKDFLFN